MLKVRKDLNKFREDHLYVVEEVDFYRLMSIAREEEFEEGDVVLLQVSYNENGWRLDATNDVLCEFFN